MRAARIVAALAASLAAGGLVACGGDDGDTLPADAPPGQRVWVDTRCGSCHTLADADSSGTVGGDLDERRPDAATVERWVREGGKGMPAYASQLSDAEIRDVARYVSRVAGR